jgi:SAM-dependent methyltransferase
MTAFEEKEGMDWNPNSMVSSEERGLDFYFKRLNLRTEDLVGKKILDLGSGKEAAFASDIILKELQNTQVVSFSPHFSKEEYRKDSKEGENVVGAVAGIAQEMPFKDGSFDYVLGVWSVPFHLRIGKTDVAEVEVRKALGEAIRILAPGGELRLYPFIDTDIESLRAVLPDQGIEYSIENGNRLVLRKMNSGARHAEAA